LVHCFPFNGKLFPVFALLEVFVNPRKVFTRVRKERIWLAPFVGTVFFAVLTTYLVMQTAGIEIMILQKYQHDPKLAEKVGGGQGIDRAVDSSNERVTKSLTLGRTAGITFAVLLLITAAFSIAVWSLDAKPSFSVMLGTVSFAAFPFAVLSFLATWLLIATVSDQSSLDLNAMPGLNFSRLLDRTSSNPAIFAMAGGMDIFTLGEMLLLSFGLSKVTSLHFLQGFAVCGVIWAIAVMWKAALAVYL
jgi:hypothetical protein